jgi:hypothetical protein
VIIEPRGKIHSMDSARLKPGHTYLSGLVFKREDLINEANARHSIHQNQESSRPLSRDYELVGLIGEIQGEVDFGLKRNANLLVGGDGRFDFVLPNRKTGDWKVARKAYNLLMESETAHADILVAGLWHENSEFCWVEWMGWEYGESLAEIWPTDFGYGVINHYRAVDNLRPMSEFISMTRTDSVIK